MSPEYAMEGLFSEKSDVFSFGVLLLEIISGSKNTSFYNHQALTLLGYVSLFKFSPVDSYYSLIFCFYNNDNNLFSQIYIKIYQSLFFLFFVFSRHGNYGMKMRL